MSEENKEEEKSGISIEEAQQSIEYDCFIVDIEYGFQKIQEQNNHKRFCRFMFFAIDFIILALLFKIGFIRDHILFWLITYVIGWLLYYYNYVSINLNLDSRWINMKKSILDSYFKNIEGYDKMEDWVRNTILKRDLAPYAGLDIDSTEDN